MDLTKDDIQSVANLARLEFSSSEIDEFTDQLQKIVTFVEKLNELNTEGVEEMAHPLDVRSVLRNDELESGLTRDSALSNSPNHDQECFLVPPVFAQKT